MSNAIATSAPAPLTFNFNQNAVRTVLIDSEPWFCAKDVCEVLGYANHRKTLQDNCKEKGVTTSYTLTDGGRQSLLFINEPNVYRLIIRSRKPEAEKFETWLMEEVLPQIRKTGRYAGTSTQTQTQGLSAEQTYMIQSKISKIAKGEAHIYRNIYSALKRKFGVKKYVDIPNEKFWDAISFLNNCELEETLTPMQKIEALAIAQKIKIVSEGFVEGVFTLVKYHRMFTQKQERLYYLIDQICDELKKSSTFLWDAAHEPTFALHKVCKELAELGYDVEQNEPKQITNKQ